MNNTNCEYIRPLLSDYYDGEAAHADQLRVEKHLAGCEDCRQVLAEYRAIGGGMRALPVPVPPSGLRRDVWRAINIDAQQPNKAASRQSNTSQVTPIGPRRQSPAKPFIVKDRSWGRAAPLMGLVAVLVILVGVLTVTAPNTAEAAKLLDTMPTGSQPVRVEFSKFVNESDAKSSTSVRRLEAGQTITETNVKMTYDSATKILSIAPPKGEWEVGVTYEVYVNAQNIHLDTGDKDTLGNKPLPLEFALATLTPTATSTPPETNTPVPTNTAEPTTVAEATSTQEPPTTPIAEATNTPEPQPTSAATNTPAPEPPAYTKTPQPSATPQHNTPTPTATKETGVAPTSSPVRKGTPTTTPQPACSATPVNGFGNLWNDNAKVRGKLGCQLAEEMAIPVAAEQRFQGGYMFWREDTHIILVFLDDGSWIQYADTWRDGDPTPAPLTPPSGSFEPERGFGKIWRTDAALRQKLGRATDRETNITAAWQPFANGNMLWTSDRYIRVLYDNGSWTGFADATTPPRMPPANGPSE